MINERQLLDSKITRWESVLKRVQIRLQKLRELRAQYDVDDEIEEELRELLAVSDNGINPTKLVQVDTKRVERRSADGGDETNKADRDNDIHERNATASEDNDTETSADATQPRKGKR